MIEINVVENSFLFLLSKATEEGDVAATDLMGQFRNYFNEPCVVYDRFRILIKAQPQQVEMLLNLNDLPGQGDGAWHKIPFAHVNTTFIDVDSLLIKLNQQ